MADVERQVTLDASTWERVDRTAEQSGRTRDQVIEDSVRRSLAGAGLANLFARVRTRSTLSEDQALEIAAEEKAAARAETRVTSHSHRS